MVPQFKTAVAVVALTLGMGLGQPAAAQVEVDNNFKFNSGQDVQPAFEGWSRNADGTFVMHFGYLNRNWVQELSIPVGPGNSVEPGGPDRGQPTFFYTRTQRNIFSVVVPKDWGKKEVVWTITANGKTQKAFGWLQPEWEIDPAGGAATGGQTSPELRGNKPPTFDVTVPASVAVGQVMPLVAAVTDDGIPKPAAAKKPAIGQETPPGLQASNEAPVNLPQLAPTRAPAAPPGTVRGPFVTWMVYRGPAGATFESRNIPVKDGKAPTSVSFSTPGEYVLLGRASDRVLFVDKQVTVTVTGGAQRP
ncbi:MAG TPA: hypothetical protein VM032_11810 [Vicinamibacterales bacterium]|nr:hypothetical protein [Vicinamibacterales bacterium]